MNRESGERTTGLEDWELRLILGVLETHPKVRGALLFGSRAKAVAKRSSDIDLALEGDCDVLEAQRIAGELDELPLPYTFDVVALSSLDPGPLLDHITRVGLRVFRNLPPSSRRPLST